MVCLPSFSHSLPLLSLLLSISLFLSVSRFLSLPLPLPPSLSFCSSISLFLSLRLLSQHLSSRPFHVLLSTRLIVWELMLLLLIKQERWYGQMSHECLEQRQCGACVGRKGQCLPRPPVSTMTPPLPQYRRGATTVTRFWIPDCTSKTLMMLYIGSILSWSSLVKLGEGNSFSLRATVTLAK